MNYSWLPGEGAEAFTVVFNSHNLYVHEAKLSQKLHVDFLKKNNAISSSSSSVGATACCGLWSVEQYLSICPYLSPTLSIFSLATLEDLFPLFLSILSSFLIPAAFNLLMSALVLSMFLLHMLMWTYYNF